MADEPVMQAMSETIPDCAELIERLEGHFRFAPAEVRSSTFDLLDEAAAALRTFLERNKELETERDEFRSKLSETIGKLMVAEAKLAEAMKALDGLLKPFEGDDCRYDHHGYCQAHFLQEGDECCVKIARRVREGGKVDG